MNLSSEDVLFLGRTHSAVSWYRTGSPALALGCDWKGGFGPPGDFTILADLSRNAFQQPEYDKYKIIVVQQAFGKDWAAAIRRWQDKGIKVLYEIDDYIHGVHKIPGHAGATAFAKSKLPLYEECMRAADGLLCSTEFLVSRYGRFNSNAWVCRNGIEGYRYRDLELPKRDTINIGWAGGEGHQGNVQPWLRQVETLMEKDDRLRFICVGLDFVATMPKELQRTKAVHIPFVLMELFPGVLCNFDIALAPAGKSHFYKAKSDLRWLETGALGIPLIGDPFVYPELDGERGLAVADAVEARTAVSYLVENEDRRLEIGARAREYILNNRTMEHVCSDWERAFLEVTA
jgi:glycosyltransferase involved in cell wall biosynthesis